MSETAIDHEARDGDRAVYRRCELGDQCPDHRPGTNHAHLVSVTRKADVDV